MKSLDIQQTVSTPRIVFDPASLVLVISGESYPENSFDFYAPVASWIKEALPVISGLKLNIDVSYLNSSSTKCMLDLFDILEDAYQGGSKVAIEWYYDKDNPRSLDLAEEFSEEVTLPFSILPHPD